jgi:hypothetical protein
VRVAHEIEGKQGNRCQSSDLLTVARAETFTTESFGKQKAV